ncbi:FBF1 factor, partial [Brachypteracias leptosomus]|nr:FBF1 factor [Brachypteracias leptosomus]
QDMDDMDAELLGLSKPSSGLPGKTTMKGPEKWDTLGGVKTTGKPLTPEKGGPAPVMEKKPLSSKKFNFEDLDDPLAGLLSDEEQDAPKKSAPVDTKSSPEKKAGWSKEKEPAVPQTPLHTAAPARRRAELVFEDDDDDFMDALGFGSDPKGNEKQGKKAEGEELRPARHKLDELLGRGSVAKVLEQPSMGERREFKLDKKYQKQPEKEEDQDKEDYVFGAYQPMVASMPKGQLSRRQSVSKFSAENSSEPKPEPRSKPLPSAIQSPVRSSRAGGAWLGLKDEDFMDLEPQSPVKASPAVRQPSPAAAKQPSSTSQLPAAEEAAPKPDPLEEESWLTTALARKKAQAQVKAQERNAKPLEAPGEGLDPRSPASQPAPAAAPQQAAALQDKAASTSGSRQPLPWLSTTKQASAPTSEAAKGNPSRDISALVPTGSFPGKQEVQGPAPLVQVGHWSLVPKSCGVESSALGLLHERPGAPTAHLDQAASGCQAALLSAQARVAELESQVRTLELERTQQKLLQESLQQRHQQDLDLLENSYRSRMQVLEESCGQREERLRREKEQLEAQLLGQSQAAERARAELLGQHQERLAALSQQNVLELERVRELQRVSVQEMRRDHEEQLQRLKRLKEQEIEAVTSAISHTRSLSDIVEQMQKFSSDLHDLSHKLEAMHHTTSQELATEAQQRDKQFKALEDRLLQQQRGMVEERSQFQEVMTKMEARLSEQLRLLEQGQQRVTTEQSKVESMHHSLEEQRRVMTHQLSMERAELEREKVSWGGHLQVLFTCPVSLTKAALWCSPTPPGYHLSLGKMEIVSRTGQVTQGFPPCPSQEQAELKIRGRELKAKEEQLVRDRELLEQAWQELRLEKEKVAGATLRLQQREEEVKSMTKLSSQQCEEGERALREARRIECEHQSRLQGLRQHLEQLSQQEQQLQQANTPSPSLPAWGCHAQSLSLCQQLLSLPFSWGQERLSMAHQRRQLQQLREELSLTTDQDLSSPTKGLLPSTQGKAAPGSCTYIPLLRRLGMYLRADRSFLEDEQLFLESLKKASYNTSPLSR